MPATLTGAIVPVLAAQRSRFNARFAEARRTRPTLNPAHFSEHLTEVVAPLVDLVSQHAPESVDLVAEVLYDLSLDLVGRDLLGPSARYPAIVKGWTWLLRTLPDRLAEAPHQVAGAITNALYQLSTVPDARPHAWLHEIAELNRVCQSAAELLEAGKVCAWRAGLAHYRQSALAVCRRLRPAAATAALGLRKVTLDRAETDFLVDQLLADPWLSPAAALRGKSNQQHLHLVARAGGFRGFGGQFLRPPQVTCPGGQFVASDGDHWLLHADLFGATFHRLSALPNEPPVLRAPLFKLGLGGKVSRGRVSAVFPDLAVSHSSAANEHTLAVTTPLSHAVFLIAMVSE